jgi:hypothetical protein
LTPNVDRNLPPETWITAAPMDTLTAKDPQLRPIVGDPTIHIIPVLFHMYWAGSDADGSVAGFYFAVTETTTTPDVLTHVVPSLPGPKARDYRFTAKTDTTFIFNVSETSPDRQHAFYIYAVDNRGKPDPTPATFFFTANDRFPPIPLITVAQAIGKVYGWEGGSYSNGQLTGGRLVAHDDVRNFTDKNIRNTVARDTGSVNAILRFKWQAKLGVAGSSVKKNCYQLEEPDFLCVPPQVDSVNYASGFAAGLKLFTLRTVDQAGGAADSTRRFNLNYMPDTWFSGPDPYDTRYFSQTQNRDGSGDRWYITLASLLSTPQGMVGTLMSPDSFKVLPALRQPRKTFFEIYNGKLYAHVEGDTVHMGSWVLFYNGGYDKDSRYRVRVDLGPPGDPGLPWLQPGGSDSTDYPVLLPRPENGSPVGFRSQVVLSTDVSGQQTNFAQTGMYPIYQPSSVFRNLNIGGYWPMFLSGKAYALGRAEDGDGQVDTKVEDARTLAELVDHMGGTPAEHELRDREIITYYVNRSPFLMTSDGTFLPKPDGSTTYTGPIWSLKLPSDDVDPYDPSEVNRKVGGPTPNKVLRYKLTVLGKSVYTDRDTTFIYDPQTTTSPYYFNSPTPPGFFTVPCYLKGGAVKIRVELCDCIDCERVSGQGRCVTRDFNATYVRTCPEPASISSPDRVGIR